MGLLLSYFRRPKDSVAELESIEAQLSRLEAWRQNQLRLQKRLLGYLLIAFLIGYPSAVAVYYVYWPPVASRLTQLLHAAAFISVLPLFYALRRCLLWIFVRSLAGCESRAGRLREDKRKVLDRVMDTETYKRAKEILDRFDPDRFKAEFQQPQPAAVKPGQFFAKSSLAKRPPPQQPPQPHGVILRQLSAVPHHQQPPQQLQQQPPPPQLPRPQLPRPVLSRDRSTMDRIIDLLVGDGADRRYALICRRCCGHNGMAMAEEFPHLAWRCAYCAYLHSPRQPLPNPPVLTPLEATSPQQQPAARPQWQSLTDLRPAAAAATPPAGVAVRDDSSSAASSAASTPAAAVADADAEADEVNGKADGAAADASASDAEVEAAAAEPAESGAGQVRRRAAPVESPSGGNAAAQ